MLKAFVMSTCDLTEHIRLFEYCASLLHNLPWSQPQINGGISEQQMHCKTRNKRSYSLIDKKFHLYY